MFSHDRYAEILSETVQEMQKLAQLKGGEYAGDVDRLANFRRNGENLGLPMSTVWAVYAGKHWDAINQYIKDKRNGKERERIEPIEGRVDDLLVYCILFKCILEEERGRDKTAGEIAQETFGELEKYGVKTPDPRTLPGYKVDSVGKETITRDQAASDDGVYITKNKESVE